MLERVSGVRFFCVFAEGDENCGSDGRKNVSLLFLNFFINHS